MRLLIFSDIHGNYYALNELVKNIDRLSYDKAIFCGDIWGYYYEQEKVFNCLEQWEDLIWLKGNHDEYYLKKSTQEQERDLIEKYGHSYVNTANSEHHRILSHLQEKYIMHCDNLKIGIFHGTPDNPLEGRLYPKDEPVSEKYGDYDIVILGHTHFRMTKRYDNTLIVNPGSLGQPRDGNGYSYAILDTDSKEVEFFSVYVPRHYLMKQIKENDPNLNKLVDVLEREPE